LVGKEFNKSAENPPFVSMLVESRPILHKLKQLGMLKREALLTSLGQFTEKRGVKIHRVNTKSWL
jgi:hypothetical protein